MSGGVLLFDDDCADGWVDFTSGNAPMMKIALQGETTLAHKNHDWDLHGCK
jgi:hypothetical protein